MVIKTVFVQEKSVRPALFSSARYKEISFLHVFYAAAGTVPFSDAHRQRSDLFGRTAADPEEGGGHDQSE